MKELKRNVELTKTPSKLSYKKLKTGIGQTDTFKKYVSPTLNFLNAKLTNSLTKPAKVGQLTELFNKDYEKYLKENNKQKNIESWREFYTNFDIGYINPRSKEKNVQKLGKGEEIIRNTVVELKNNVTLMKKIITEELTDDVIKKWVEDLIFTKTFRGLCIDEELAKYLIKNIISKIKTKEFEYKDKNFRQSTPEEEGKGIDFVYTKEVENKETNEKEKIDIFLQVKTGNTEAGKYISKVLDQSPETDLYYIYLDTTKNPNILTVEFKKKTLYQVECE